MFQQNPQLLALKGRLKKKTPSFQGKVMVKRQGQELAVALDSGGHGLLHPQQQNRWMVGEILKVTWDEDQKWLCPSERQGGTEVALGRLIHRAGGGWKVALLETPWVVWPVESLASEGERTPGKDGDVVKVCWWTPWPQRLEGGGPLKFTLLTTEVAAGDPLQEVKVELLKRGYVLEHPLAPLAALEAGDSETTTESLDLTHLPLFSIDDVKTLDVDDAIGFEAGEEGLHRLHVAISAVESRVSEGTAFDAEAEKRGCSHYFPDFELPMLPPQWAYDTLSLLPRQKRLAWILTWEVDEQHGRVNPPEIRWGHIQSRAKWDYATVSQWLKSADTRSPFEASGGEIAKGTLQQLWRCAARMAVEQQRDGGIWPSVREGFNWVPHPESLAGGVWVPREMCWARRLIEVLMIQANKAFSERALQHPEHPFIFMGYEGFDEGKLEQLQAELESLGWRFELEELKSQWGYREALMSVRSLGFTSEAAPNPLHPFLGRAKSQYLPSPHRHLGFQAYGTWTSPIRKYSDLWNLRHLKRALNADPPLGKRLDLKHLQQQRLQGRRLERQLQKQMTLRFWDRKLRGQSLPLLARVCDLGPKGLTVELVHLGLRGWLPLEFWRSHRATWRYHAPSKSYRDAQGVVRLAVRSMLLVGWKRLSSQGMEILLKDLGDVG